MVPFKSSPIQTDNFGLLLQQALPSFFMLMFIPVLYRTVYRIVFEKATRAKEAMRMMGMGEFAYWSSWLVYYTVVNTILVTLSWAVLMINCLSIKSGGFIWLFLWHVFLNFLIFKFLVRVPNDYLKSVFNTKNCCNHNDFYLLWNCSVVSRCIKWRFSKNVKNCCECLLSNSDDDAWRFAFDS